MYIIYYIYTICEKNSPSNFHLSSKKNTSNIRK